MWLCGTWQLSLQLKQENSSSSPTESSRPRPTTSQPACPHVSTAARQETAWLGSANSLELHINYRCRCSQSLPWIIGVNEQQIRSAQVSWASQKVKKDIKENGATRTCNPKYRNWSVIPVGCCLYLSQAPPYANPPPPKPSHQRLSWHFHNVHTWDGTMIVSCPQDYKYLLIDERSSVRES